MKELFHGYYKPTEEEFQKLWDDCLFSFDANILLNLYRYSDGTKQELLKNISDFSDRGWLANQAAEEYFRNRISTTGGQVKEYDKAQKNLDEIVSSLGNKKRHPFISDELMEEVKSLFERVSSEFEINKENLNELIHNDPILDRLTEIFDSKVGTKLPQATLDQIYKDGKIRFENEIPPGFRDGKKDESGNLYRKYGDLIIWHELINKAKEDTKDIVFVTDDKKDDWWYQYGGKTIGPLPFLVQEFKEETGRNFYMYTADRFLKAVGQYSKKEVNEAAIEEIKEFRKQQEALKELLLQKLEEYKSRIDYPVQYKVASEEEIFSYLLDYEEMRKSEGDNSFIGLKHFVTDYLANKGIEINHAYATINDMNSKGSIELYDKPMGNYLVKAVRIKK